jgi:hypothetical protein
MVLNMYELPCLICGKVAEPAFGPNRDSPPSDALLFISYGNYGSTVFDSVTGGEYLLTVICDRCITAAGEKGQVLHCIKPHPIPPDPVRKTWRADKQVADDLTALSEELGLYEN